MLKRTPVSLILWFYLVLSSTAGAQTDAGQQFKHLQAAWIYNIARFIEYPAEQKTQPLRICLTGNDAESIGAMLRQGVAGRQIQQRSIEVSANGNYELTSCQLIYLTAGASAASSSSEQMLYISGPDHGVDRASLFALRLQGNKLELLLNKQVLQQSDIRINPSLLRLARPMEGQ